MVDLPLQLNKAKVPGESMLAAVFRYKDPKASGGEGKGGKT